jgi:hypothetical protein
MVQVPRSACVPEVLRVEACKEARSELFVQFTGKINADLQARTTEALAAVGH